MAMNKWTCTLVLTLASLIWGCARTETPRDRRSGASAPPALEEASGVVRDGDALLLVGDEDAGSLYRYSLNPGEAGPVIPLPSPRLTRIHWPAAALALDAEGIERLTDGRVVILSEQLAALVDDQGLVAAYGGSVNEFGGRGLEGVAVRPDLRGGSRVAVLWEGGYPSQRSLPPQLRSLASAVALDPLVWIHDLPRDGRNIDIDLPDVHSLRLQVPRPEGVEPHAQRFRAPDLVWHRIAAGDADESWGFIVLISSGDAGVRPTYQFHWLQRFDHRGVTIGDPLDLDAVAPTELRGVNWEGMGWYEEGRSLVLVFEHDPETTELQALVVRLPRDWILP